MLFWVLLSIFVIKMSAFSRARTLIVATTTDIASLNIANAVVAKDNMWREVGDRLWQSARGNAMLWLQDESLLKMDNPQKLVPGLSGDEKESIEEVIFLSRHAAASGVASLTVHPIGVAWLDDDGCEQYGGKGGRCSPPSSRIGRIYRNLLDETKKRDLQDTFQITMEATHHGPFCEIPACFVEIGSDEKTWPNKDAAAVWADLLEEELNLPESDPDPSGGMVVALLGGGHYIPKMNDCARFGEGVYVGHSIASYGLQNLLLEASAFEKEGQQQQQGADEEGAITWRSVVMEAITSTKTAHPSRQLVVLIDKKAFKADGRALITDLLDDLSIPYCWSVTEVKKLYESKIFVSV